MPENSDEKPKPKRKVPAYPFEALLEVGPAKKAVEALFISQQGMIVRLTNVFLSVGEYHQVTFELPVLRHTFTTLVRVYKTYDKVLDVKEKKIERLAELHFEKLDEEHRQHIGTFCSMIGQKK